MSICKFDLDLKLGSTITLMLQGGLKRLLGFEYFKLRLPHDRGTGYIVRSSKELA
jgi:hypothetical protein